MIARALASFLNPMCDDEDGGYALKKGSRDESRSVCLTAAQTEVLGLCPDASGLTEKLPVTLRLPFM